jgi:hypothetical protein
MSLASLAEQMRKARDEMVSPAQAHGSEPVEYKNDKL